MEMTSANVKIRHVFGFTFWSGPLSFTIYLNKGRFRSKPISAFVDNFALHQSQRFNFEIINKKSKKISSHSKASVSNNFHVLGLKPKGYIQAQIYLKFYRGTFLNSAQNGNYGCLN